MFDYDSFRSIVEDCYEDIPKQTRVYSIYDYLGIFRLFFECFERYQQHDHPMPSRERTLSIMKSLPFCIRPEQNGACLTFEPEDYYSMIPKYFETFFPKCNYHIYHFLSGRIRELRYMETVGKEEGRAHYELPKVQKNMYSRAM